MPRMPRYDEMLNIARDLTECVRRLDALQVGDYQGRVSPIKHRLQDALQHPLDEIYALAQQEYIEAHGSTELPPD